MVNEQHLNPDVVPLFFKFATLYLSLHFCHSFRLKTLELVNIKLKIYFDPDSLNMSTLPETSLIES